MSAPVISIVSIAAGLIKSALDEGRIKFDKETTEDVTFALDAITAFFYEEARPADATTFHNTPLQPWTGTNKDVEGRLTWALGIVVLELSEDSDNMNARLEDGRRTRIGSAHEALNKLLTER